MHYYPFNVKDYTYDTQHLSLAEHGALRLLIDRIHLREKPLDSDETEIFRLMHLEKEEDKEIVRRMLKEFFIKKKNGFYVTRPLINENKKRQFSSTNLSHMT